jgi:hypothetical protein
MRLEVVTELEKSGLSRTEAINAVIAAKGIKKWRLAHRAGYSEGHFSHLLRGGRTVTDEQLDTIEAVLADEINQRAGLEATA